MLRTMVKMTVAVCVCAMALLPFDAYAAAKPAAKGGGQKTAAPAPVAQEDLAALRAASAAYSKKDYATAIKILTPVAEKGSAQAAFFLGLMAVRGHGMPMSTDVAEKWWKKSADGGDPNGQYNLGLMHHRGLRGARNAKIVADLWTKAAANGQGDAMYGLGYMYRVGDGVKKDVKKSVKMFTDAAKLGQPGALYELGLMYKHGRGGVAKNAAKAEDYLKKAAAAGVSEAAKELNAK